MFPEDLLADLPPVRDDEPSSLRRDIADELADHLKCAARREQVKSNGADDVERRVLERFGNPRQIARRLWWLAMWSRIMSQRVLLGFSLAGNVLAILLSVAVFWQFGRERVALSRERAALTQRLDEQRTELTSQLAVMAATLEQVKNRPTPTPALPPGQPTLKVRLTGPQRNSFPPPSASVTIEGRELLTQSLKQTLSLKAGASTVNFGKVVAGKYRIQARVGPYVHAEEVTLADGDNRELVIPCPTLGPDIYPQLAAELPQDLESRGIVCYAEYDLASLEHMGDAWSVDNQPEGRFYRSGRFMTCLSIKAAADSQQDARPSFGARWPEDDRSMQGQLQTRPFAAAVMQCTGGETRLAVSPVGAGVRVRLAKLVLIDDAYPVREEQREAVSRQFNPQVGIGGGGFPPQGSASGQIEPMWTPAILIFDYDRLRQFPTLVEPVVVGHEPIRLILPPELLNVIRDTLAKAYAADARFPTNRRRSRSPWQDRPSNPESRSAMLERSLKIFRP